MELEKKLAELKASLEGDLDAKAKAAIADGIKDIEAKIATLETDAKENKALQAKVDEYKKAFDELKVKFDANQELIDKWVVKDSRNGGTHKPETIESVIKTAVEEKTDEINKFLRKETKSVSIELKAVGDMTLSNVTGTTQYGAISQSGIIQNPARKVHIRQLVPGGSIGPGTDFYFMRENGNGEGNPATHTEGSAKAQLDFDLIEASVKVETIAGYARVTKKAMQNIPGFISFLQARMPERLLRVEDAQLLYGDGVSPNISGILDSGNYVDSTSTSSKLVEKIIDDLALLEDNYERTATGILLRPVDYFGFFKNKADGSGEYDLPQNVAFVNGVLYISGVPVAASTAVVSGDYVVGDFMQGAQLLTQNGMRLEFFEQDADNVTKNKVTIRIEEDIAFPIYGSNYFIKGAVPAAV